jgi:hypothetical protein
MYGSIEILLCRINPILWHMIAIHVLVLNSSANSSPGEYLIRQQHSQVISTDRNQTLLSLTN